MRYGNFLLGALLALSPAAALAADNYQVKDATGATITIRAKDTGAGYAPQFVPTDASGNPLATSGNPFFVSLNNISSLATAAGQTSGNTSLSSLDTKATASNASLTSIDGKQSTGNASLAAIDTKAGTGNASLASIDTKATSSNSSLSSLDTKATARNTSLASIDTKTPALVAGRQPVDGSGVTQPVSATALPLPAGAATSAKQAALGTAGAASTDVLSVQGIANGVPFVAAPPASSSISVQRTANIGTTGTLVSASDGTVRRTVSNTSGVPCEIVSASGGAYGTGYPLGAGGGSFSFDATSRTTAALYVACASAGGAAAVISY